MAIKELERLKSMLENEGIPFDWSVEPNMMRLEYPNGKKGRGGRVLSAIQGNGSYGNKVNRIEIMGLPKPEDNAVAGAVGWLTAEEVYDRINKHFSKNNHN